MLRVVPEDVNLGGGGAVWDGTFIVDDLTGKGGASESTLKAGELVFLDGGGGLLGGLEGEWGGFCGAGLEDELEFKSAFLKRAFSAFVKSLSNVILLFIAISSMLDSLDISPSDFADFISVGGGGRGLLGNGGVLGANELKLGLDSVSMPLIDLLDLVMT
jgi:hypothetical protein